MKISIVIPVYFNEDNLKPLYADIKEKLLSQDEYEWELVMVNDGSGDGSYRVMQELAREDKRIRIFSLSRNFGSHAAILCGLSKCTGDCAVVKAADMQEPTELVLEMVGSWKKGNNVVLAVRKERNEKKSQTVFANLYYWMVRKTALPDMPKGGFDVYLLDRKVIEVLMRLDERNSALTGQILWSGFRTEKVYYTRLAREIGSSKWTMKKKVRLVSDTLFSFSSLPITVVSVIGTCSCAGSAVWATLVFVLKLLGMIDVSGWTTLFIFNLFSFGVTMLTLGILGGYLWRAFDASRNRPPYIIEDEGNADEK
ncbi:MAG: glycosyltransferase family 2 protein [bacterium]|nr:glycosyltransferase family 2 protein [bacterium]MCM1500051.1 glycosyltransferase family 2 protein [Clostridium sp.]